MQSDNKSALVLGADGFLGRHLVRRLLLAGWEITPVGRAAGSFSDVSNVMSVFRASPKVSRIFHVITRQRTGPIQYELQGELLATNSRIHLNVLDAWREYQPQAKLISTGSSCAYPDLSRAIVESDFQSGRLHPSVYGYGLAKELLAVGSECYAKQYGMNYLHLVLATLYGPGDHKEAHRTHFLTGMIDRAIGEKRSGKSEFSVWGTPDAVRDLLHVDDQIDAILQADGTFDNCLLNCTSNSPTRIGDAASAICTALNWTAEIVYPAGTFRGVDYKSLDSSKFLERTAWQPRISLQDGIREVVAADYKGILA